MLSHNFRTQCTKILISCQRHLKVVIAKAYKTAPNAALPVIADSDPFAGKI